MSDVRQKAKDLLRLALDEGTSGGERGAATLQLLRLIDKYDLLSAGGKPINVATDMLTDLLREMASPNFMDGIADRAERFASGVERSVAAFKRVTNRVGLATEPRESRERGRRRSRR
jgi:hypothetical protein